LLSTVDRVSRLPRNTTVPEAMRLYRENITLKTQLDALEAELAQRTAPVPMVTRAAQAFAYFLTRARRRIVPVLLPLGLAAHHQAVGDVLPAPSPTHGTSAGDRRSMRRSSPPRSRGWPRAPGRRSRLVRAPTAHEPAGLGGSIAAHSYLPRAHLVRDH
jgi:hypothetical protein